MGILYAQRDRENIVSNARLRLAIFECAGTNFRTVKLYTQVLQEVGWLRRFNGENWTIEDKYILNEIGDA